MSMQRAVSASSFGAPPTWPTAAVDAPLDEVPAPPIRAEAVVAPAPTPGVSAGQRRADRCTTPRRRPRRTAGSSEGPRDNRFKRVTLGTVFLGEKWASLQRVRVPDRLLAQFARNLGTMYNSGVPIGRAIQMMTDQPESLEWGVVIATLNKDLQNGRSLEACFASYPNIFGPTWMALIRRAMEDGSLGDTLVTLAQMLERGDHLRARVRVALTYPLIVFGMSILVALGAFFFLLPQILGLIVAQGHDIPVMTQILMYVFNVATNPLFLVELPLLVMANVYTYRRFISSERGKLRVDRLKVSCPLLGPIFRKIAVARVMHSMCATTSRGMRLMQALELAGAACGNRVYNLHLLSCVQGLRDGERLSSTFAPPNRLYDPMVFYSVHIGEECGQLDRMFETLAQYYDLQVSSALDNLLTVLEPVLILGTGLMVAFVVIAVFLPLYGMVGQLGG